MYKSRKEENEFTNVFPIKDNFSPHDCSLTKYNDSINLNTEGLKEDNPNDNLETICMEFSQKNSSFPLNTFEFSNSILGKPEYNSIDYFSRRKRNREEIENNDEQNVLIKKEKSEDKSNSDNDIKIGRRLKNEEYKSEAKHNKKSEDNIITKIKTAIFKYILEHLNDSLQFTKYKFYPLNKKLNTNLKRDKNLALLNKTIFEIYMNEDLNKNYINGNDSNKILIKKIIEENKEKKTINLLNMKFIDILDHIREKDLDNFLNRIKNKEKKNKGKHIDSFMEDVKHLLLNYEKWFRIKNGRKTAKE